MKLQIHSALIAATAAMAAGCATTSGSLAEAAYRLDRSADALYDEVRRERRDPGLERDALQLADAADDFHRDVKDRREREELRAQFDDVARQYHEVREELEEGPRPDASERTAFQDVTRAYLDLERELQYRRLSRL